jgi:hypothetical protein
MFASYSGITQELKPQSISQYLDKNWSEESKEFAEAQKILDVYEAEKIYKNCFYYLNYLNDMGDFYTEHPSVDYLYKLLNEILLKKPDLEPNEVRLFVSKNPNPDAYVLPDGSIIVNIGLFNYLKNESQIASVISQKLFHYQLQHSLRKVKIDRELNDVQLASFGLGGTKYMFTNYPKGLLAQADLATTNFLLETRFDVTEYLKMLPILCNLKRDSIGFGVVDYIIDLKTTDTTGIFREIPVSALQKRIDFNSNYQSSISDECYNSAGLLYNRNLAVKDGLTASNFLSKQPADSLAFLKIAENATFETAENYFLRAKYYEGFYESLILCKKFPESIPAQILLIKNQYWLCKLKQDSSIYNYSKENNFSHLKDVHYLRLAFNNVQVDILLKNLYTVTKGIYEKAPDNEMVALYYALVVELSLGKAYADAPYNSFIKNFPKSIYKEFVSNKLVSF